MNNKKILLTGLILTAQFFFVFMLQAEVKLPAIFGDHMVLQQKTSAAVWGTTNAGNTVTVKTSWDNKRYSSKAGRSGKWMVKVNTPSAGGPYDITISDGKPVTLKDVLIGEVWICSGQSNMEMPVKGYHNQPVLGSNEAITTSQNEKMRLFTVKRDKNLKPLDDFTGEWKKCEPVNVSDFSATAYYFGRMIQQTTGVPVGLVCSAWGGTRIEPWISESGIKKFDWVPAPAENSDGSLSQQTPTVLFNAMINPMVGYGIRGAIWYQGESNRNEADKYAPLMEGLVSNWRNLWGIGDFPFYYVQIAPFDYGRAGLNSAYLREAQLKASMEIPNSGMACLMDVGEADCIHPAHKQTTGERLAFLALEKTYGLSGFESSGPILKDMNVEGNVVRLTFDHAENGLTSWGNEIDDFEVAGQNKRFYPAKAFITRQGITLFSPSVNDPVAVRYAFKDFVVGDLFNTEGLPASSFRTDEWEER